MTFIYFTHDRASRLRPDKRRGAFVVVVDVCGYRTLQGSNAGERATSNSTIGDIGKETFDSVQPRRTGRGEMNVIARMFREPRLNHRVLMRRIVIHYQMNIKLARHGTIDVVQKLDELFVPMARHATLDYFTSKCVEGGKQSGRAVPAIIVRLSRGNAGSQRQDRRRSLECLDSALFVHAQNNRIGRRIHVKTNNIAQLRDEIGVRAKLEILNAMRLQIMSAPQAIDRATAHAKTPCHLHSRPMRRILRNTLHRCRDDFFRLRFAHFFGPATPRSVVIHALNATLFETPANRDDVLARDFPLTGYLGIRYAARGIKQHHRAPDSALRGGWFRREHHQFTTNRRVNMQRWSWRKRHV